MKRLYFLMLALVVGIICLAIVVSARTRILYFIHAPSTMLVVLTSLLLTLSSFSPSEIADSFCLGFKKDGTDPAKLRKGILFFDTLRNYVILSGLTGVFIGLIAMLAEINDTSKIGLAMSMTLLAFLYAVVFLLIVVVPFRTGLKKRLDEVSN